MDPIEGKRPRLDEPDGVVEQKRQRLNESTEEIEKIDIELTEGSKDESQIESTDNNKSLDESTDESTEDESDDDDSMENCRLRNDLNEHCLCEIFKYLSVYDLIQLCELDNYFQDIIKKWVIGKKLVNFTKMDPCWTTNKIFQVFGKSLRKIKIADENTLENFEYFLKLVGRNCEVESLTELKLRFRTPEADQDVLNNTLPYFTNLTNLCLKDNFARVAYSQFLTGICTVATNLSILTLDGVDVEGDWLKKDNMVNLTELRLHSSKRTDARVSSEALMEFLKNKPKLEVFSYIGSYDTKNIGQLLVDHCPTITTFEDVHLDNPYNGRTALDINDNLHRYGFVSLFPNLKSVTLTSYTYCGHDMFYPLVKLAAKNRIEELKVFVDIKRAVSLRTEVIENMKHSFHHFTSLKTVTIEIESDIAHENELIDFKSEFLTKMISKLPNINKVSVICEQPVSNVNKLLELAPNIRTFDIALVKVKNLPWEMRKVFRSIQKNHKMLENDQRKLVHVIANKRQWRELEVYKKFDVMTTEVDEGDRFNAYLY